MEFLKKIDYKTIIIAILAIVILLLNTCSPPKPNPTTVRIEGKPYEVIKTKTDTVYKTVKQVVYKPGKTIFKEKTIYPNESIVYKNLDSIAKQYYGINVYKDTLKLEQNLGYVTLNDTITENKLKGRVFKTFINQTTIKETTFVKELPKNQLFIGGILGGDKTQPINFIGPSLLWKTKSDKIYSISAGLTPNTALSIQAGLYWKIRLKK